MGIDWNQNCLTQGVHDGRQESLWQMPLGYAQKIYGGSVLAEMVIARVYNDAMQVVEHSSEEAFTKEWAERVKEIVSERFQDVFESKLKELSDYYKSSMFKRDTLDAVDRIERQKLNPNYEPLHHHDSINLLCRILGVSAFYAALKS